MSNKQIRRIMKNFVKHYGSQDTRKICSPQHVKQLSKESQAI